MIRIRQIKIPIEKDNLNYLKKKVSLILKCSETDIKAISISKKSLDARKKPNLYYSYMTMASIPDIVSGKDISFYITFPGEDIEISDNNFYLIEQQM